MSWTVTHNNEYFIFDNGTSSLWIRDNAQFHHYSNDIRVIPEGGNATTWTYTDFTAPTGSSAKDLITKIIALKTAGRSGRYAYTVPKTMFGENRVQQMQTEVAISAIYGINSEQWNTFVNGGGSSLTSTDSWITMTNGTTFADYSSVQSKQRLLYIPGVGSRVRWSQLFGDCSGGLTQQFGGVATASEGFYFGWNFDGTFGILYRNGGNLTHYSFQITAGAGGAETATVTLNTVGYSIELSGGTTSFTAHEIEAGGKVGASSPIDWVASGWNVEHRGDYVFFIKRGVGANTGTYSFSSATATATVTKIHDGSGTTDTWTQQSSWNVDVMDGTGPSGQTLNVQNGNVYQIAYQWHGVGLIEFSIENAESGEFQPVHLIKYANANTSISINQPNLPFNAATYDIGAGVAKTTKVGSIGMFIEGDVPSPRLVFCASNGRSITGGVETNILLLRVPITFNNKINQGSIRIAYISVSSEGAKPVAIKVLRNAIAGANTSADYTNFGYVQETTSMVWKDTTTDTYTGGILLFEEQLAKSDSVHLNLTNVTVRLFQTEELLISALSANASEVKVSITWEELA